MKIRSLLLITHLSNAIAQSFRAKILLVTVLGVMIGILFTATVSLLGLHRLADEASEVIESGLNTVSQEYLAHHIEDTAARINLWMEHAQADLRILADITQTLIDHRKEFRPMIEAVIDIPFFADKMQYYPEGGYSQNAPDEPSVVLVQTTYHDENAHIKPYPQQIIAETALLDLVMPAIHAQGAEKMATYFTGDSEAAFLRWTPWVDYGRNAIEVYPETPHVSYYNFYPGLIDAFQTWVQDSDPANTSYLTSFLPYTDATTRELVQTFAYPLWNRERTRFAGTVWYDVTLNDVIGNIEAIELAQTGFAFMAQADGNLLAIPERGIHALGLEEAAYFDEYQTLYRYLSDSNDPVVAALTLPQNNENTPVHLHLATGEFVLIMHRLPPMHTFSHDSQQIEREAWTLGFVVPRDELYTPLIAAQTSILESSQRILTGQVLVLAVTILIIIGLIYVVTGRITEDLVKLSEGAHQIMQANYKTQVTIRSRDEFGKLGRIFNDMATQLKRNFEEIEQQNRELNQEMQERKQVEAELVYERYLLHTLMDNSLDHIYFKDREHRFLRVNNAIVDWFGLENSDQILGKTDFDFFSDEHARQAYEDEQSVMRSGQSMIKQEKETWPDGRVTWVSTTKSPLVDERGGIIGTFGISRNITDQVKAEEDIKIYSEQLEEMVTERTRELQEAQEQLLRQERLAVLGLLAGSVAHELRHPLGILTNAAYYLKMSLPDVDKTTSEYLEMITAEVRKSDKIISDLLDFSRYQVSVKKHSAPVRLSDLIAGALAEQPPPEEVEILYDDAPEHPFVWVDTQQIRRVLANLLINAYQAMPDGGTLTITVSFNDEQARIAIADTGCGIAPEHLDKLFEPLFTTKPNGIGLGLAISKKLAEANGGTIRIERREERGTTAILALPCNEEG